MPQNSRGQTLIEFLLSLLIAIPLVTGAFSVVWAQWHRTRCAHLVFEATHARLVSGTGLRAGASVQIVDDLDSVSGSATCHGMTEKVRFRKLEAAE